MVSWTAVSRSGSQQSVQFVCLCVLIIDSNTDPRAGFWQINGLLAKTVLTPFIQLMGPGATL
jgi:hypothetical protein